jgi:hypothetical protein
MNHLWMVNRKNRKLLQLMPVGMVTRIIYALKGIGGTL